MINSDPGATWPQFDYELVVCSSFDAVLRGGEGKRISPDQLVSQAFDAGRVLIQAKGGSGKTTILERLAAAASDAGVTVSRLDALTWANSIEIEQSNLSVVQSILTVPNPPVSEIELREAHRTLLLIDGLNEVSPRLATLLLDEVDQLASQFSSLAVILTDRMHRRQITEKLWILATLSPVSLEQLNHLVPDAIKHSETLRLPYYLNLALGGDRGSRSDQHRTYLLKHGGVDPAWLDNLAAAAYSQYKTNGDRRVDVEDLIYAVGETTVNSLEDAGTLVLSPTCRFAHHLVHDYLAATHAAQQPDLWDSEGLDTLTFKATSMDALALVLEQATDADLLVRRVYDWNFYGAASLIAEDRQSGSRVSAAMELAVVTMLGERRFDRFSGTAHQVSDALQVIDTEVARAMSAAPSKSTIIDYVRHHGSQSADQPWLGSWVDLYTREESEPSTVRDVDVLASDDSVLGWTMSNVIRRSRVVDEVGRSLAGLAANAESDVVRWRAVHALGADPTSSAAEALFKSLDEDDSTWVRYGSVRSLVEIALTSDELRGQLFDGLVERVPSLRTNPSLTKELERVLLPVNAPPDWSDDSALLVETLWAKSISVEEQDRWRRLGAAIRALKHVGGS